MTEYKALLTGSALFTAAWHSCPCGALNSILLILPLITDLEGALEDLTSNGTIFRRTLHILQWYWDWRHKHTHTHLTLTNTWLVPAVIAAGHLPKWQGEFLPVHSHLDSEHFPHSVTALTLEVSQGSDNSVPHARLAKWHKAEEADRWFTSNGID